MQKCDVGFYARQIRYLVFFQKEVYHPLVLYLQRIFQ